MMVAEDSVKAYNKVVMKHFEDDITTGGFTEEPDKTRRIESPVENPERLPERQPERKREDFEPERKDEPDRERKPEKIPA